MIGTLINVATVVVGAVLGRALGARLPDRVRETVMHVIALVTFVLGIGMVLKSADTLVLLFSLVLGALTGEVLGIEAGIERLGRFAEQRLTGKSEGGDFVRGFVTTSILFCVGPMTIIGCLNDGLRGDYRLLAVKATLDGISSVGFASALGWGVLLSAITVLLVQGGLTLGARALEPVLLDPAVQNELFATGGVLMLGLGFRLLELKPIRVANLLPALAYAPLLVLLVRWAPVWWRSLVG
jgi:hypothetical protein